jgi:hypothetical protein
VGKGRGKRNEEENKRYEVGREGVGQEKKIYC